MPANSRWDLIQGLKGYDSFLETSRKYRKKQQHNRAVSLADVLSMNRPGRATHYTVNFAIDTYGDGYRLRRRSFSIVSGV